MKFVARLNCLRPVSGFIVFRLLLHFGFQILERCEFLNPGGSMNDRVAVKITEEVS